MKFDLEELAWLVSKKPSDRTSTFNPNSERAIVGTAAEIVVCKELNLLIEKNGINATVEFFDDHELSAAKAISNSQNGDLTVAIDGKFIRTIEVKVSTKYANATMSASELEDSRADFIVCITTAGLWACTMNEARRAAILHGKFYIIPYSDVKRCDLLDVVNP